MYFYCSTTLQDTALTALKVSAQLCGELLGECHSAPPEALLTAAMQLHDHALLVRMKGTRRRRGGGIGLSVTVAAAATRGAPQCQLPLLAVR